MKSPSPCSDCENGTMHSVIEDFRSRSNDGNVVTVPEVTLYRCDNCHETLIPATSLRKISEYEVKALEQLSPEEVHGIFDRANVTQKDYAEALGLGEKTFHRWLKGTQTVSRSMGYYLRAMDQFPEVFEWVAGRGWNQSLTERAVATAQQVVLGDSPFFALERRATGQHAVEVAETNINPARALMLKAVHRQSV